MLQKKCFHFVTLYISKDDFELDKIVTMMKQYLGYDEDDRTDETGQTPEDEQADMQCKLNFLWCF